MNFNSQKCKTPIKQKVGGIKDMGPEMFCLEVYMKEP